MFCLFGDINFMIYVLTGCTRNVSETVCTVRYAWYNTDGILYGNNVTDTMAV
jgi:hypothetical protein